MTALRGLIARVLGWLPWFKPLPAPPSPVVETPEVTIEQLPPLMPAPKPRPRRKRATEVGAFWYFDNLLDQLPECRKLMRKMRTVDPEAYAYNVRMGARVMPDAQGADYLEVPATFLDKLPAAGMVFVPPAAYRPRDKIKLKEKDRYDGVFTYFHKLTKKSWNMVIPKDGVQAVYRCSCVYTRHDKKAATGATFAVALIDGIPRLISELCSERTKAGFYRQTWGYPHALQWWHTHGSAAARKEDARLALMIFGETVEDFAASLFAEAAHQYTISAADNFQVRAERENVSIGFSVALGRTPYFFKDRERMVNVDGATRRIFHHVEAHERTLATGKTVPVKNHYRGLRRFTWKGEQIVVTSPDWSPFTIDIEAQEFVGGEKLPEKYWTQAQVGEQLRDFLEADPKARAGIRDSWRDEVRH